MIPAHPLALTAARKLDERRQRALTRYYAAAGAGGIAVAVHTTQFEIRDPAIGLLQPVLELAAETARECDRRLIRIAGVCGPTAQAVSEASLARDLGYDIALLSMAALPTATDDELIDHARTVGEVMPLFGFYLQSAVGGRDLGYAFWRRFAEIPSVVAIKIAPFDRYKTLDVVRGVADSGRADDVTLYTGNDDNIVHDLVTAHEIRPRSLRMVGGQRRRTSATHQGWDGHRRHSRVSRSGHRQQRGGLRRRASIPWVHRRVARSSEAPGAARWHLVPRPRGRAVTGPSRRDRSRARRLPRSQRRRIRGRAPRPLDAVTVAHSAFVT